MVTQEKNSFEKIYSPIISESWRRCTLNNVNSGEPREQCLSEKDFRQIQEEYTNLIEIASPFMENLYGFVKGSSFVVVLLNKECYILEIVGDKEVLDKFPMLRRGENWNEELKGTNAMGTVCIEKKPLQVHAGEHFCNQFKTMTCSASPIFDMYGNFIGVLDMTGDYRKTHAHTLGMVVAAVQAIEHQLQLEHATREVLYYNQKLNAVLESMSDGVFSFDREGRITLLNQVAKDIVGGSNISEFVEKLFQEKNVYNNIIKNGQAIHDQEVFMNFQKKVVHFFISGMPLKDKSGYIRGGVMTLKEIKKVHKLVTHLAGAQARFTFDDIVGADSVLNEVVVFAKKVARVDATILLEGESGTGKEMFAQSIHNGSLYRHGPFVALNCGAIPRDLIESELFGYEEGSFTGAKKGGRPGKFELANGGTIFLDEIATMPFETQVSLLRVLQEKQFMRVGGNKTINVNCRIIAATNKDLSLEVKKGNFREDLYFRLDVIPIALPPLRKWGREGIISLINHFIDKLSQKMPEKNKMILSEEAMEALISYAWPGNIRELSNTIERAVYFSESNYIKKEHLPDEKFKKQPLRNVSGISLKNMEKKMIEETLEDLGGNIKRAAEVLGITRATLYRKMKELNLK